MLDEFKKTGNEALEALKQIKDSAALEEFRIEYLSRKGKVTQMLSGIGKLVAEAVSKLA